MLGSDGDGLLIVGELVVDEDRVRWSTWIFVTSAGWNGFRHIGQTLRVKDLRHLEIEVNTRRWNKRNRAVCTVWVGINLHTSNKTRAHTGEHGELYYDLPRKNVPNKCRNTSRN